MKVNGILLLLFATLQNGWKLKQELTKLDMKWEISFMNCFVGKNIGHFTKPAINVSNTKRLLTNILVSEKLKLQNSILGMV